MSYRNNFEAAEKQSLFAANSLLWRWLQSGSHRAKLYEELSNSKKPILKFQSRITVENDDEAVIDETAENRQHVYLLTKKEHIDQAFLNFSSEPYKALGSGYPVVLASDNNDEDRHALKRKIVMNAFDLADMRKNVETVIGYACHHALVLSSKKDDFDFVSNVAEEASLFYVEGLYGIDFSAHPVLHDSMEAIYSGMAYQMLARHFISEPGVPVKAMQGAGALITILDATLQAALSPKLMTEISELLVSSNAEVKLVLRKLIDEIVLLKDPGLDAALATTLMGSLDTDENIPFNAYQFIDQAMNLHNVRVWVANELTSGVYEPSTIVGNPTDEEKVIINDIRELVDLIRAHKKEKDAPDDNLIPVKFQDPITKNYMIRETVISRLAKNPDIVNSLDGTGSLTGGEFITELAGTISGTIGNFVSSSSIAIKEIIKNGKLSEFHNLGQSYKAELKCNNLIMEALRLDPPAPFLPRLVVTGNAEERTFQTDEGPVTLEEGANVLIPMGAYTHGATTSENPEIFNADRDNANLKEAYSSLFGQASPDGFASHKCTGERMAMPFLRTLIQKVSTLHNVALKEQDAGILPLQKKWGFVCEKLPLVHKAEEGLKQNPLNVVMKIKTPIAVHAEYLKKIIYYGAPVVDNLLESSNVVHFARFIILNHDTELALITTYDGGYDEYLEYFAEKAGPLFDMIFQHIEDAPPMPVRDNVQQFADHISRFDIPSTAGYFYSAYPKASVAEILKMRDYASLVDQPEMAKQVSAADEAAKLQANAKKMEIEKDRIKAAKPTGASNG